MKTLQSAEQWSKLFTSPSSRIQILLDQTDQAELSEEWLTVEESCAHQLREQQQIQAIPDLHQQDPNLQPAQEETADTSEGIPKSSGISGQTGQLHNLPGDQDSINTQLMVMETPHFFLLSLQAKYPHRVATI